MSSGNSSAGYEEIGGTKWAQRTERNSVNPWESCLNAAMVRRMHIQMIGAQCDGVFGNISPQKIFSAQGGCALKMAGLPHADGTATPGYSAMCESRYILPQKPQPELRLSSPFDFRPGMRRAAGGIHIFDSTRHGNESSLPGKNHTRHIAAGQIHTIFFRLPDETMEGSDHKPVLLQNLPNMAGCIIKRERPHIIRKRGKIGGKFRKVNVVDFKRPGCHLNLVVGGNAPGTGFHRLPARQIRHPCNR